MTLPTSISLSITHFTCLSHQTLRNFSLLHLWFRISLVTPSPLLLLLFRLFTSPLIPSFLPIDHTLPLPCPISLMNEDARREDKGNTVPFPRREGGGGINKGGLVTSSVIVWIHILDMPSRESSSPLSSCLSTSQVIFPPEGEREGRDGWHDYPYHHISLYDHSHL